MLDMIFPFAIIILLWYIAFDCSDRLSKNLSKTAILVFTAFVNFLLVMIYLYWNADECYNHLPLLKNGELIVLLLLVPTVAFISNLVFMYARIPKLM